jgi:hypothetical protein
MSEPIRFFAQVSKVQTMPDMGLRLTLDFSEKEIMQAAMLMECKRMGVILDIVATPQNQTVGDDSHDSKKGRPEVKSLRGN